MPNFEELFMAGFDAAMDGEEKVAAEETPVLDKALANLGLLEEEEEGVEMPVLKQAMENLGLLEEDGEEDVEMPVLEQALENLGLLDDEEGEEKVASSMLEALAMEYGHIVAEEREALEKEAARGSSGMIREKARSIYKTLSRRTGARDIRKGVAGLLKARRMKKDVNEPHAKKQLGKRKTKAAARLGRGAAKAGLATGIASIGARMAAGAVSGKKKDKKKKK